MSTLQKPLEEGLTAQEADDVRIELRRILEGESFSSSQRCRDFLECVVEATLMGDHATLTERFLGVKLFGRAVDYETSTDSIVRVRANDVRRRLIQHYSRSPAKGRVQIELAPGRYTPEFHWLPVPSTENSSSSHGSGEIASADEIAASAPAQVAQPKKRKFPAIYILIPSIGLLAFAVLAFFHTTRRSADFEAFWRPVLDAPGQPVLNLPTTDTFQLTLNPQRTLAPLSELQPGQSFKLNSGDFIGFHDWHVSLPVLQAALSVSSALSRAGKTALVRVGTDMRRDELRGHPVIAIGSFSNPWTEANVNGLRFTFDRGTSDREPPRIRDRQNPSRSWSLPHTYPDPQQKDYAIVTRTFDPSTGEPFLSLAGLHSFGNQIAGEFVSQDDSWKEIARRAPRGWEKMNLQILLEADVVGTTPGSARIIDLYCWKDDRRQ